MTKQRILIPHRIIPPGLYVQRDADRQLQAILEDMASPGYVLVSRQMGKTNMLLNAKRSYQTENDVYTYIDLSNSFNTDTECFRNIIDKSLDTHKQLLGSLKDSIKQIRTEQFPPHLEHLQELRTILNHISGKMVIILDEIDALTRATFSDKIFSQIRSIYFERDSYPELNRLTYILSGVVEPTEIIKNPKISPFNIGQKIFLDDFSIEEHNHFISKANLDVEGLLSDRIFFWTSGNPRMTYDICSEIELESQHSTVNIEKVDEIVKKLYLTSYDKPPIDHIRELVTNDKSIRDALLLIRYGNGSKVEDNIKTKLYLAGIIGSDFSADNLRVKNRVIDQSLSETWMRSIEKRVEKPYEVIIEFVKKRDYRNVTEYYLTLSDDTYRQLPSFAKYNVGLSHFKLGEFAKAIELFKDVKYDPQYESNLYLDNLSHLAESYSRNELYDDAIRHFEMILELDKGGKYSVPAMLSLANIYVDFAKGQHQAQASAYLEKVINSSMTELGISDAEFHRNMRIAAYLYYGRLQNKQGKRIEAHIELDKALAMASNDEKPAIMLAKLNFNIDKESSIAILGSIVDIIIETRLTPDPITGSYIYFSPEVLYEVLEKVFSHLPNRLQILCAYLIDEFAQIKSGEFMFGYYQLGIMAVTRHNMRLAKGLLEFLLLDERSTEMPETFLYSAFKVTLSTERTGKESNVIASKFYEFLSVHRKYTLSSFDLDVLISYADLELMRHDFSRSQQVLAFLSDSIEKSPEELRSSKYIMEFMEIKTLNLVSFNDAAQTRSKTLLNNLNRLSAQDVQLNPLLGSLLPTMKNLLTNLTYGISPPPRALPKVNENDRVSVQYNNGKIIKDIKFRKVKKDISSGQCRII